MCAPALISVLLLILCSIVVPPLTLIIALSDVPTAWSVIDLPLSLFGHIMVYIVHGLFTVSTWLARSVGFPFCGYAIIAILSFIILRTSPIWTAGRFIANTARGYSKRGILRAPSEPGDMTCDYNKRGILRAPCESAYAESN